MIYNVVAGGKYLEDFEVRRNDTVYSKLHYEHTEEKNY
jgi:hypothetical protein